MRSEKITFSNGDGARLGARLDLPSSGEPTAFALFAHCFTCTKNLHAVGDTTERLASHGVATLRFDFTGLGESEGDFAETNFSTNVDDLLAAAAWLESEHAAPALLVGHSLGGAAVIEAAARLPSVAAVATIAAPASPDHILRHIEANVDEIEATGEADVHLGGRPFRIRKQFLDDISSTKMRDVVGALQRPLLIMHSPVDNVVGVDNAARIFEAARHPKSYVSLDHADHLLGDSRDSAYAGTVVAAWSSRYVAASDSSAGPAPAELPDTPSKTVVRTTDGFRTDVSANGFLLVADEPETVGGTNLGPTPYDLLLAALGACTSMTLRIYADRKRLPLDAVSVVLEHAKIHSRDCADCEKTDGYLDRIYRTVALEGDLDDAQRARLIEIADRCPVHKTLEGEIEIRTTEA